MRLPVFQGKDFDLGREFTCKLVETFSLLAGDHFTLTQFKVCTWWFFHMRTSPQDYGEYGVLWDASSLTSVLDFTACTLVLIRHTEECGIPFIQNGLAPSVKGGG